MGLHECGLPEDKLPHCWNDDVRMNALFAPFRLKTANPESWEMKMKFWSDMIRQWCRVKGDPVVSASDAKVAFHRKGRTPACIDIIVEEMFRLELIIFILILRKFKCLSFIWEYLVCSICFMSCLTYGKCLCRAISVSLRLAIIIILL